MSLSAKTVRYLRRHCGGSLAGKTVLITGATSGIGLKTAEILLYLGAEIIMACRNGQKAAGIREQLMAEYPDARIRTMRLDMADFHSIDAFAEQLPDVDVFINNAGVYRHPGEKTADGFQLVIGTNYLGVYRLSEKILPKLEACGHDVVYINTISIVYKTARVNFSRFQDDRGSYPRSKLCLARYTCSLARRCKGTNVHVLMSHPGIAVTGIAAHAYRRLYRLAPLSPFNTPEKSALAAAWILTHTVPEGSVVGPKGFLNIWGYPGINRRSRKISQDIEPLLDYTGKLVKEKESPFIAAG